jgi:hypothetical protein
LELYDSTLWICESYIISFSIFKWLPNKPKGSQSSNTSLTIVFFSPSHPATARPGSAVIYSVFLIVRRSARMVYLDGFHYHFTVYANLVVINTWYFLRY